MGRWPSRCCIRAESYAKLFGVSYCFAHGSSDLVIDLNLTITSRTFCGSADIKPWFSWQVYLVVALQLLTVPHALMNNHWAANSLFPNRSMDPPLPLPGVKFSTASSLKLLMRLHMCSKLYRTLPHSIQPDHLGIATCHTWLSCLLSLMLSLKTMMLAHSRIKPDKLNSSV